MKQIPKYQQKGKFLQQTEKSDNTRVQKPIIIKPIKRQLKPGEYFFTNRDGSVTLIKPKDVQISQDNRSSKQRKKDQTWAERKRKEIELEQAEQQAAQVAGEVFNRTMPSTIARAVYDAATGNKSFAGSMIEGNEGLGNPTLNLAFDVLAPYGTTKGFNFLVSKLPNISLAKNTAGNWNGWINVGKYQYRPNRSYLGMGKLIEREPILDKIIHQARIKKFNPILESDIPELEQMVANGEYKIMNIPKVGKVKMYFPKGNKQPIREDELLKLLSDYDSSGIGPLQSSKEAVKITKDIRSQYAKIIEKNTKETGIDWSDQNSIMASMPDQLKASSVGFDLKTPFLKRYYENVINKVLGPNGIQNKLLKNGELRLNSNEQWEGLVDGKYIRVEPTEYIKMRIANEAGASYGLNVSLAPISPGMTRYPRHGTKTKNYNYLRRPSFSPGRNGYWTGIQGTGGSDLLINHYKGTGASIPFFRMPLFETNKIPRNPLGIDSNTLMPNIQANPGRIQIVNDVIDSEVGFGRANEYNFGPNVPNPKSMWNTLDFEEGAGPLAYISKETQNNFT